MARAVMDNFRSYASLTLKRQQVAHKQAPTLSWLVLSKPQKFKLKNRSNRTIFAKGLESACAGSEIATAVYKMST